METSYGELRPACDGKVIELPSDHTQKPGHTHRIRRAWLKCSMGHMNFSLGTVDQPWGIVPGGHEEPSAGPFSAVGTQALHPDRALPLCKFFLFKCDRGLNTADIARDKELVQSFLSSQKTVYTIKLTGLGKVKKQISHCKQIGLIYSFIVGMNYWQSRNFHSQ